MNFIPYVLSLSLAIIPLQITSSNFTQVERNMPRVEIVQPIDLNSTTSLLERKSAVKILVLHYADKYKVNPEVMMNVLTCENDQFDPDLQSYHPANSFNGRELSFGLAQLHLPSHPEISIEQATDPDFSIEYMASEMSKGRASQWSCYKQIYGVK